MSAPMFFAFPVPTPFSEGVPTPGAGNAEHHCLDRDGQPIPDGSAKACWVEARRQILDEATA